MPAEKITKLSKEAEEADVSHKEEELSDEVATLGAQEKLNRLKWSVAVRYLMISVVAVITIVGYEIGLNFDLIGVLIAATIAFVFNLTSNLVYRDIHYPKFWPYIGVFLDMIVITLIVHATGGVESIFLPLYLLQLVGTNVHFSKLAAPMNLIFGGGMFIAVVSLEFQGILPHNSLGIFSEALYLNKLYIFSITLTMISLMGISSYRSGYVVRSLQTVENELLKANRELLKLNVVYSKVNRRLKEIDQMKTEFISVASHQMRTPLSAIKWVLRMLLDGDLGQLNNQQIEMLTKGYQTNERMILLINDLLNVSRIEEGRFQYRFVHMSLEEVVESVIQELFNLIKKRSIKFVYNVKKGEIPKLNFDPQKIRLVVQNLIDNAVKFTPPGGKVTVNLTSDRVDVNFSVTDSGVGIPTTQQNRIFSKFFRADNVVRMQTDGSGLGLFIVKNVIDNHHGRVWFESIEGKGATFTFSLPIQVVEKKDTKFEKFMKNM